MKISQFPLVFITLSVMGRWAIAGNGEKNLSKQHSSKDVGQKVPFKSGSSKDLTRKDSTKISFTKSDSTNIDLICQEDSSKGIPSRAGLGQRCLGKVRSLKKTLSRKNSSKGGLSKTDSIKEDSTEVELGPTEQGVIHVIQEVSEKAKKNKNVKVSDKDIAEFKNAPKLGKRKRVEDAAVEAFKVLKGVENGPETEAFRSELEGQIDEVRNAKRQKPDFYKAAVKSFKQNVESMSSVYCKCVLIILSLILLVASCIGVVAAIISQQPHLIIICVVLSLAMLAAIYILTHEKKETTPQ